MHKRKAAIAHARKYRKAKRFLAIFGLVIFSLAVMTLNSVSLKYTNSLKTAQSKTITTITTKQPAEQQASEEKKITTYGLENYSDSYAFYLFGFIKNNSARSMPLNIKASYFLKNDKDETIAFIVDYPIIDYLPPLGEAPFAIAIDKVTGQKYEKYVLKMIEDGWQEVDTKNIYKIEFSESELIYEKGINSLTARIKNNEDIKIDRMAVYATFLDKNGKIITVDVKILYDLKPKTGTKFLLEGNSFQIYQKRASSVKLYAFQDLNTIIR
ncbi:MAG: hypothetical protein M1371_04170 [Actinobacteria bacterium]|nr:hypothetical protein [Actinomycetota bacterium]